MAGKVNLFSLRFSQKQMSLEVQKLANKKLLDCSIFIFFTDSIKLVGWIPPKLLLSITSFLLNYVFKAFSVQFDL